MRHAQFPSSTSARAPFRNDEYPKGALVPEDGSRKIGSTSGHRIAHECLIGRPLLIPRRVKRFAAPAALKESGTASRSGVHEKTEAVRSNALRRCRPWVRSLLIMASRRRYCSFSREQSANGTQTLYLDTFKERASRATCSRIYSKNTKCAVFMFLLCLYT